MQISELQTAVRLVFFRNLVTRGEKWIELVTDPTLSTRTAVHMVTVKTRCKPKEYTCLQNVSFTILNLSALMSTDFQFALYA